MYDVAVPNGAERIFRQFEAQAEHRRALEHMVIVSGIRRAYWGLAAGFVIALAFLTGAVIVGQAGHDTLGEVLGGGSAVSLAGSFIGGAVVLRRERAEKQKRLLASDTAPQASQGRPR